GQAHLLVRVDDEQRTYGQGVVGIGVDQVVQLGHLAVGIGQDREVDLGVLRLVDVIDPPDVRVHRVDRQCDGLDAALGEFILQLGGKAQFGGADGSEVRRVGE